MVLSSEKKSIVGQLSLAEQMLQKLHQELARLGEEKDNAENEKDKLQKDAVFYVELNTKLQQEKEKLQQGLVEAQRAIETKESDLERLKLRSEQTQKKTSNELAEEKEALNKQRKDLLNKITRLNKTIIEENALYNYNLGVAYTQAKLFDEAKEAYEKALIFSPKMPEAHYNLALLYEKVEEDYKKALSHYGKYLELVPDTSDKEEIETSIKKLTKEIQEENQ
jgi:tetratricopeptide (TPR) repeat protein